MSAVASLLRGLSDVEGVTGSFVVRRTGEVVATDLPSAFDAGVFAEVTPRLERLLDASAALGEETRSCTLRFSEHKLYVRQGPSALIGVLVTPQASLPALKVAASLVARKLEGLVGQEVVTSPPPAVATSFRSTEDTPPPVTQPSPALPPLSASGSPSASPLPSRRTALYRGRPVE